VRAAKGSGPIRFSWALVAKEKGTDLFDIHRVFVSREGKSI